MVMTEQKGRQFFPRKRGLLLQVKGPHIFSEQGTAESKSGPDSDKYNGNNQQNLQQAVTQSTGLKHNQTYRPNQWRH